MTTEPARVRTFCSSPGKTETPLARNRQFESGFLQQRVSDETVPATFDSI